MCIRDNYKAIYAKEGLTRKNSKEPTISEIAEEIGIPDEDIVFALDAIQSPVSLYEPVYTEGGDTLYVMDQISDKKNREELWIEELSLSCLLYTSTASSGEKLWGVFGKDSECTIPWCKIRQIGPDIILVDLEQEKPPR